MKTALFKKRIIRIILIVFVLALVPASISFAEQEDCDHENLEFLCENNNIVLKCMDCEKNLGTAFLATNNTEDLDNLYKDKGVYQLHYCQSDALDIVCNGGEDYFEELSLIYGYYQEDGSLKYSLKAPTGVCSFTACIAVLEDDNNPNSFLLKTEDFCFELKKHRWEYKADETSLYANCALCQKIASVSLDRAGAEYACRNFDADAQEHFDYEIFYQKDWKIEDGLEQFFVLYDGIAVNDEFNSTLKNNVFYKPTISGNCTARLVLLSDIDDVKSVYLTTGEIPYYLAGISIGDPYLKFTDYSEGQYQLLEAPKIVNNAYQVGSFEELYWVSRYGESTKDICITQDIVVNPICLVDGGESIRVGSNIIYTWPGIGNENTGCYKGTVYGNGHTIYGLYSKGQDSAGFIKEAGDCNVYDLTISDSIFSGNNNAGGLIAHLKVQTDGSYISETKIENCMVVCSQISQVAASEEDVYQAAGGLIGEYEGNVYRFHLSIKDSISDSSITGRTAGGFVGYAYGWWPVGNYKCDFTISNCVNKSKVYATYIASGGFFGVLRADYFYYATLNMKSCSNLGEITASNSDVGGFFGRLYYISEDTVFEDNINVGKVYNSGNTTTIGEFFGALQCIQGGSFKGNKSYENYPAYGGLYNTNEGAFTFEQSKIEKSATVEETVCKNGSSCKVSSHWVQTRLSNCENDGELVKSCLVCGKTIYTKTIEAHSHNYVYGKCLYCLESEPKENDTGSIFSKAGIGICISGALLAVGILIAILLAKRSKEEAC